VPGLRREEVAELASVSVEWYRRFERGASIRVSCQVVYRITRALRLSHAEAMELFCLSVPEVYRLNTERVAYSCPGGFGGQERPPRITLVNSDLPAVGKDCDPLFA
jgi:hypothetical protein